MQITINGDVKILNSESISLHDLLINENISIDSGIAVAVNFNVISKKDWTQYFIKENDQVTIIKAVQGG